MPGILETLFEDHSRTIDKVRAAGVDPKRAEQAYSAAVGTVLRGLETQTQTKEGAGSLWDMLRNQVEKGNIPSDAPSESGGIHVRDMDPKVANDMLKAIFGENAPQVQGGFGKVIILDPETSQKVFAKVLPAVLGAIFGAAQRAPQESPQALPDILGRAREEMEQQQPKSTGVFNAIFDRDHDGDVDLSDLGDLFRSKPR